MKRGSPLMGNVRRLPRRLSGAVGAARSTPGSSAPSSSAPLRLEERPAGVPRFWRMVSPHVAVPVAALVARPQDIVPRGHGGRSRSRKAVPRGLELWVLVCAALRIPAFTAGYGAEEALYVPPMYEKRALRELTEVAAEALTITRQPLPLRDNTHWALLMLLTLVLWHGVRVQWWQGTDALNLNPEQWVSAGALDVFRTVHLGEWYRTVTALTLHSDSEHLFGNVLFGAPFLVLLCRRVGLGVGLALALSAGMLGNVCNALYRLPPHLSLGFSTSLFGIVGALSAIMAFTGVSAGRLPNVPDLPSKRVQLLYAVNHEASKRETRRRWRQAFVTMGAGGAVLALLGADGEKTDYLAHVFGLLAGFGVGGVTSLLFELRGLPSRRTEIYAGVLSVAVVAVAWWLAWTMEH